MDVVALLPHLWIVPSIAAFAALLGLLWWFGFSNWFPGEFTRRYPRERMKWDGWRHVAIVWWSVAALIVITWVLLLMPFNSKYHVFFKIEGEVTGVTRSFIEGTGDLSFEPVVTIQGFDQSVVVNDSRIYAAVGSEVSLTCSLEWVPYGADRTSCFISGVKP